MLFDLAEYLLRWAKRHRRVNWEPFPSDALLTPQILQIRFLAIAKLLVLNSMVDIPNQFVFPTRSQCV